MAVAGIPDQRTGYVIGVDQIDHAVRKAVLPLLHAAMRDAPATDPALLLPVLARSLERQLDRPVHRLRWRTTPYHAVTLEWSDMTRVLLSQTFEFAAAHRLHAAELSEAENERVFGKCNRPHGHGHNYRIEVTASAALPERPTELAFSMHDLERIVHVRVIEVFDHRNLNIDLPEFADRVPSLEWITESCFRRLEKPIADAHGRLERVQVWETEKTACTRERMTT